MATLKASHFCRLKSDSYTILFLFLVVINAARQQNIDGRGPGKKTKNNGTKYLKITLEKFNQATDIRLFAWSNFELTNFAFFYHPTRMN